MEVIQKSQQSNMFSVMKKLTNLSGIWQENYSLLVILFLFQNCNKFLMMNALYCTGIKISFITYFKIQQSKQMNNEESIDSHITYSQYSDKHQQQSESGSHISYGNQDSNEYQSDQSQNPLQNNCISINVSLTDGLTIMPYGFSFANSQGNSFGISISSSHYSSSSEMEENEESHSSNYEEQGNQHAEYHIDFRINRFDPDDQRSLQYFGEEIPFSMDDNQLLMLQEYDDEESPVFRARQSLTTQQIKRFPLMCWEKVHDMMNRGQRCSCCLEEYNIGDTLRVVTCMHRFHHHCIDEWLLKKSNCPLCKHNFIN